MRSYKGLEVLQNQILELREIRVPGATREAPARSGGYFLRMIDLMTTCSAKHTLKYNRLTTAFSPLPSFSLPRHPS